MYRIWKTVGLIPKPIRTATLLSTQKNIGVQNAVCVHRFYSKQSDDKPGSKGKKQVTFGMNPKKPPLVCPPNPADPKKCDPRLPYIAECQPPPEPKVCPPPDPSDEERAERKKFYTRVILGALFTAATIGAIYIFTRKEELPKAAKKKKKPKKIKKERAIIKDPADSSDIPNSVPYLLIGGGTASFSAFRAIKSTDPKAKVLVITNEGFFPYMRPPLSKEMWFNDDKDLVQKLVFKQWNGSERSLFYEPDDFYMNCKDLMVSENGGVSVARGWNVDHIDVENKIVRLEDGYEIEYEKCLLATGALPRNLEIFESAAQDAQLAKRITVYRNIYDFEELYDTVEHSKSVAIVGGGFLGSELACALAKKGKDKLQVYQIFRESGNMGKILPEYLSLWTTEKVKSEGAEVVPCSEIVAVDYKNRNVVLTLTGEKEIRVDHVIVAVGAEPNTELAESSGLEVDPDLGGYVVNTELQARTSLYIAGDCACFYDTKLGRRRVEHHDHAVVSGRLAGENMAGAAKPYLHQSMFWSDLGPDVGYEAIGIVDSTLPTVGVFAKATDKDNPKAVVTATDEGLRSNSEQISEKCKKIAHDDPELKKLVDNSSENHDGEDFGKGVIFYLRDDVVVGIVLWNVFNRMSTARQVLKDGRKYEDLNEVAKLFNIHEE